MYSEPAFIPARHDSRTGLLLISRFQVRGLSGSLGYITAGLRHIDFESVCRFFVSNTLTFSCRNTLTLSERAPPDAGGRGDSHGRKSSPHSREDLGKHATCHPDRPVYPLQNLKEGYIKVRGKGNKERMVPIGGATKKSLTRYIQA